MEGEFCLAVSGAPVEVATSGATRSCGGGAGVEGSSREGTAWDWFVANSSSVSHSQLAQTCLLKDASPSWIGPPQHRQIVIPISFPILDSTCAENKNNLKKFGRAGCLTLI